LLAKSVGDAARFMAERGGVAEGAPVLVRLIAQVASRFGVVVTQKLAAQAVPLIGALGGAAVNFAFIDHFQEVARAHFVVRGAALRQRYGACSLRTTFRRNTSRRLNRRDILDNGHRHLPADSDIDPVADAMDIVFKFCGPRVRLS
jgi:hypothetical protein